MAPYKKDQGRMARMVAFWSLAVLIFYGCTSLHTELASRFSSLAVPVAGIRIPVIGVDLNPAVMISTVILVGSITLLYRWQQAPKQADLLIETESELRKVTWPTISEATTSSIVVMLTVLFLMAFLAGSDVLLGRWASYLLTGRG
jgi:preprotein translocase SecE subunit